MICKTELDLAVRAGNRKTRHRRRKSQVPETQEVSMQARDLRKLAQEEWRRLKRLDPYALMERCDY